MTQVTAIEIISLHQSGNSIKEICVALGISANTATRRLAKVGYKTRRRASENRKNIGGDILTDGSRTIPIGENLVAVVDGCDYERVNRHCWCPHIHKGRGRLITYAQASVKISGKWRRILLHRFILSPPIRVTVDHRDGDGLNCRRNNMRLATHGQNQHNSGSRGGRSRYKGVSWSKAAGRWLAQIMANRKYYYLGLFDSEESAAKAYDQAARELHGEYAKTNF